MSLPYLNIKKRKSQKQTISFYGINYTNNFRDGELSDCMGLSSSEFPCLSQRGGYGVEKYLENATQLYGRGGLYYIEDNAFYYEGEKISSLSANHKGKKRQFATINSKIVIFPDKMYYDTLTGEFKSLDSAYDRISEVKFTTNTMTIPEKVYYLSQNELISITKSEDTEVNIFTKADFNKEDGTIKFEGSTKKKASELAVGDITNYDCGENEYLKVTSVDNEILCVKYSVSSINYEPFTKCFKAGDTIEITGLVTLADNNGFRTIRGIEDYTLTFDKDSLTEGTETAPVRLARDVPDLDYICESNNHLWGVNVKTNTIYSSVLGDPTNFKTVDHLSTDSWQVAVGSDGEFTGCIGHSDNVLFFKENCVHKLLGSYPAQYQLYTYTIPGVQKGSDKSMCIINETLFYKGVEGIYAYNGGAPELISSNFGTRKYFDAVGGSYQNKYYISMRDELSRYSLYSYDLSRGIWLLEENIRVLDFAKLESTLYFLSDNKIFKMGEEEEDRIKWSATFCPIDELYHGKKGYSKIWLKVELSAKAYIKAEISVDGAPYRQVYLGHNDKQRTLQIPIKSQRCDTFSIRLSGEGRCRLKSMVREFYIGSEV